MNTNSCIYCHLNGFEGEICPKCGNETTDLRKINFKVAKTSSEAAKSSVSVKAQNETNIYAPLKRPKRRRYPVIIWSVLGLFAIAGIGQHNSGETTNSPTIASQSGANDANQVTQNLDDLAFDPNFIDFDKKHVPILVGTNAKAAFKAIDGPELYSNFVDKDGFDISDTLSKKVTGRGSWDDFLDPYFVCDQDLVAGAPILDMANKVTLKVSTTCKGKKPEHLAGIYAKRFKVWGPEIPKTTGTSEVTSFQGWIVGVDNSGFLNEVKVHVQTPYEVLSVALAGISKADPACLKSKIDDVWKQSLLQAKGILPVGSPVRVTLIGNDAQIYTLSIDDASQSAIEKPESVNEELVAAGYWVPSNASLNTRLVSEKGARWKLNFAEGAPDFDKKLVRNANDSIKNKTGPFELCN